MVVKKFGSQRVYLTVNVPANGYVIDLCVTQTFGLYRLHTPQLAGFVFKAQIAWVLYGQASRAISIG